MTESEMRGQARNLSTSELREHCGNIIDNLPRIVMSPEADTLLPMLQVLIDELKDRNADISFANGIV